MEGETILKEVLSALSKHSERMEKRFEQVDARFEQVDARFEQVDARFDQLEKRFDRLETKFDGARVELTETQETTDYLSSKSIQHEKKLRELNEQLASTL